VIPPIGSISAALQASGLGGAAGASAPSPGTAELEGTIPAAGGGEGAVSPAGEGGFGEALSSAISSLEQTQQGASGAAQSLATGTASDPESAVVSIDEAQLAMQLASQIRAKATEAAQQIFQTQV
jgi:flagellar hook-basal body complex protein FliE